MSNKEVLLRVEHLCQYFKLGRGFVNKAVDDVSFDVYKGEVFGLVGESGCGKTTTGRSIIKLYDITSGNVFFKGQRICAGTQSYKDNIQSAKEEMKTADAAKKAELRKFIAEQKKEIKLAKFDQKKSDKMYAKRLVSELTAEYDAKIAAASGEEAQKLRAEYREKRHVALRTRLITQIQMIFQDPIASLDPRMTVKDIISEGLIIQGVRDKEYIMNRVNEMLETVGLVREHAGRYPHEFSGGQRQRIGVARSIVMEPSLIIADEPISALDVSIRAQVINLLNDLRHELGITILFIAHDLSVVKYFSDRIGVMYFGKLVELAESDELFKHPLHPYTRSLLSAIPLPDPEYERNRKRITYNPIADHDYRFDKPSLKEVAPGHFVLCDNAELEKYRKEIAED